MTQTTASLSARYAKLVCRVTGAASVKSAEPIQSLWSGYGQIVRFALDRSDTAGPASVVLKHVRWPHAREHPRGWNTDLSHQRKVTSYRVETQWYRRFATRCDATCRVPQAYALESDGDDVLVVLEDLDAAGFGERRRHASAADIQACLVWLANFHATFLHESPEGLWATGTYWHLATRPDELARLDDGDLKDAAPVIDAALSASAFQTFVHGDAKLANFCFARDGGVAAVDFQYVGGGCGMKDVAYFISSCLDEDACEQREPALLDAYFRALQSALEARKRPLDFAALERDWRALYPVAWTDFYRFLQGWSPGHWKIHRYSERLAREVVQRLGKSV